MTMTPEPLGFEQDQTPEDYNLTAALTNVRTEIVKAADDVWALVDELHEIKRHTDSTEIREAVVSAADHVAAGWARIHYGLAALARVVPTHEEQAIGRLLGAVLAEQDVTP